MNRREFIKLSLVTLASRALRLNLHQPDEDGGDTIPSVPGWTGYHLPPPPVSPVQAWNNAGETYISYDFWTAHPPTWERAPLPLGDYVVLTWDEGRA